jgi:tRNA dimethylallyltransferase
MNRPRLIFITGLTASGKSEFALREAERTGASILSCDSLCVYRGMDIGTAKPGACDRRRAPHFGLDLVNPDAPYSISEYIAYRDEVLARHREEGRPLLVVGGSGFYLKGFFSPVTDGIAVPPEVESRVAAIREAEGLPGLLQALRALHGSGAPLAGLDAGNPRRVEKALIRCLASGRTLDELQAAFAAQPEPLADWHKEVWMVVRPPEEMRERNRRRVTAMLEAGLVDEVRALRERGIERNPSACGAIGYREVLRHLDDPQPLYQLAEAIITRTSQLMRKQRTWFRHQIPLHREIVSPEVY